MARVRRPCWSATRCNFSRSRPAPHSAPSRSGSASSSWRASGASGPSEYQYFSHGYAATVHKAQGATVDRTLVYASAMMDRHLAYVTMTRHREDAVLYAAKESFATFH